MFMWTVPTDTGQALTMKRQFYVNVGGRRACNGDLEEKLFFVLMVRAWGPR